MVFSGRMVSESGMADLSGISGSIYLGNAGGAVCSTVPSGAESQRDTGRTGTDHIGGRMDGDHH